MDWETCGLLERKNASLNTWKTFYFELADCVLSVYEDESKLTLIEAIPVTGDTVVEVLPPDEHRKYIFSVAHNDNILVLSTGSSSLLESWMIAFIQISRGSFTPSERFSISSQMAAPLFNTTRQSELFSPLETEDFAIKAQSLNRRIAEIQSEQFLAPDPWFESPCGWLRKPDFKRQEQKASSLTARRTPMMGLKSIFASTFKKRWFALKPATNILEYYDNSVDNEKSVLGHIDLTKVNCVRPSIVLDAPPNSIDLVTPEQVYTLVADSFEIMSKWAFVIQRILTKVQDAIDIKSVVENQYNKERTNPSINFIRRIDFPPNDLIQNIMACARNDSIHATGIDDGNSELKAFFERVVLSLNASIPHNVTLTEFCNLQSLSIRPVQEESQFDYAAADQMTSTARKCAFEGCDVIHYYSSGYCHKHTTASQHLPATSASASNNSSSNNSNTLSSVIVSPKPTKESRQMNQSVARHSSVNKLVLEDPTGKRKNLSDHIKRITLRERAQEIADAKNEDMLTDIPADYVHEAKQLLFLCEGVKIKSKSIKSTKKNRNKKVNQIDNNANTQEITAHKSDHNEIDDVDFFDNDDDSDDNDEVGDTIPNPIEIDRDSNDNECDIQLDESELSTLLLQFKTLDVDSDGKITIFDIRELVSKVDPEWFNSPDYRLQCLLNESARDWLISASVDNHDEMDFEGFVRALLRKRTNESHNYGFSQSSPVPKELTQHPFWDLRDVVCTNYWNTCLQSIYRGYQFLANSNAVVSNGSVGYERADSNSVSMPISTFISGHYSSATAVATAFGSGKASSRSASTNLDMVTLFPNPNADTSQSNPQSQSQLQSQSNHRNSEIRMTTNTAAHSLTIAAKVTDLSGWLFKRGYAIPVEHLNSWKLRFFRLVERDNTYFIDYFTGSVPVKHLRKGSICIEEIAFFDFSPKTTIVLDSNLNARIAQIHMNMDHLTVFKLVMRNGRRYALGCCELEALNWVAELIRFGVKYQAEVDWRVNWGSNRHNRICLRDWLNVCSIMPRLARYCEARQQSCVMINEARAKANALDDEAAREEEIRITKENICEMLERCALTKKDFICLGVIGITLEGWDSKDEVLKQTIQKVLTGIYDCRVGFAPLQMIQTVPFSEATDFEASRLVQASLGINSPASSAVEDSVGNNGTGDNPQQQQQQQQQQPLNNFFGQTRCYICCKVFQSFTLRRCLRKKFCCNCGHACCVACCSHKIYDVESDSYADVCVHCVLIQSKQFTFKEHIHVKQTRLSKLLLNNPISNRLGRESGTILRF